MNTKTLEYRKVDFTGEDIYVGIDVHKKTWHVSVYYGKSIVKRFTTDCAEGISNYLINNYPNANYHAVYEAGYCGFDPHRKLMALGIHSIVVNPADVPTTDKEKQNKTDKIDSKKLAETLKNGQLTSIYVPDQEDEALRELQRQRENCVRNQTRVKNQIKNFLTRYGVDHSDEITETSSWTKKFVNYLKNLKGLLPIAREVLDSHIRNLENCANEIKILFKQNKENFKSNKHSKNLELIKTVPGISDISGMTLLTEIIDINRFKNFDSFASYSGLSPKEHSSGESKKVGSICKRRNARINKTLIESSWVAIRVDPALMKYYNELIRKNMKSTKAIIKVAKKLLRKIMMILKTQTPYICGLA